jgi:phosphoenolpyruvate carboxylase
MLGDLLGDVIKSQAGEAMLAREEEMRLTAKELRANEDPLRRKSLEDIASGLTPSEARVLVKAFGTYFALVNLSEQLQRGWVLRERAVRAATERDETPLAEAACCRRRSTTSSASCARTSSASGRATRCASCVRASSTR